MKKTLLVLFVSLLTAHCSLPTVSAQDTPGTVKCPAAVDTADSLFRIKDASRAITTSSTAANATSIAADSTASFATSGSIKIGTEVIYYTSKTSTSFLGLTRGQAGTAAAVHASGSVVTAPILAEHHNKLAAAVICAQTLGLAAVPNTRTVNGHALNANVTVSASDLSTGTLGDGRLSSNVVLKAAPNIFTNAPSAGLPWGQWFLPPVNSPIANAGWEENVRMNLWRSSGTTKFTRGAFISNQLDGSAQLSGTISGYGPFILNRLVGAEVSAWLDDDAIVPWTMGLLASASNHNSGVNTPADMAAVYAEVDMPRNAQRVYGFYTGAGNGTAAQHGYGLFVAGVGSSADPWGVYVNGSWPNYFGGPLRVAGVMTAGTTPITLTNAAGNILPAAIIQDSTHRFATDGEKATWTGKQDALLLSSVTVSTNVGTKQSLSITIPAGKHLVITRLVIRGASTDLAAVVADLRFGFNAGADDVAETTATLLQGLHDATFAGTLLTGGSAFKVGAPGDVFGCLFSNTSITGTLVVDVFGYLY